MRLFANASYDFISRRRTAYLASSVVLGALLAAALFWQVNRGSWLNYGVDFTGGTLVQVQFHQVTSVTDLRRIIEPVAPGTEITRFGGENEFLIRAPEFSEAEGNVAEAVSGTLAAEYPSDQFDVVRIEAVGPKIGSELQRKALFAILFSFVATLVYLGFRFEWRFGVAAIIATAHDILLTLGVIAVFQLEVSLPTVAAVLTIVGYSLNDTIIVFDRVRENLKKAGRRIGIIDVLNRSINETLPRTILTATTTLVTLLALATLGGATIREFALVLVLGIVIGTYSSIFVASPALLEIEQRWKRTESNPGKRRPVRAGAGA